MAATRWGIIGTGGIANDFVTAMKALPPEDHRLVAVASLSMEEAVDFKEKHGVEKACRSNDEVAKDPDVEIVYVATYATHHKAVTSMMLNAGKHVLCEKPLCVSVEETKQLIDLAKEKKVFLMEALWTRFFPVYKEMKKRLDAGEIGDVVQVLSSFGKPLEDVERLMKKETGGGGTLELGVYSAQLATLAMGGEKPQKVLAGGHLNENGVDTVMSATLVYSKGRTASINATLRTDLPNEGFIVGTKGIIKINDPMWCPESLETPSGTYTSPLPETGRTFNYDNSQGLMYEAAEVRRCLQQGLLECPIMTHEDSLTVAGILEQIRKQIGSF